ncbi:MAG: two-component sensor histidine kinase [Streptosporangiaceae bacterium]|jgi:signal transduction histidine kinase|nr:two-component sensor histidine kinase [Streptosporangiaceae bacterium]
MTRWPAGRVRPADAALAAAVGLLACGGMWQTSAWQLPPARHADAIGYILASTGAVALVLHRRRPLHVLAVATAAAAGSLALRYPYGPPFLAMGVAMYFVAARLPWQRSAVGCSVAYLAVCAGIGVAAGGHLPSGLPVMLAGPAGWLILPCAVGTVLRVRRDDLAQSREEEARRRAYEERLRIAREIHDVAGQRLAAINMQAAVARYVADKRPEQAEQALKAIKADSKKALQGLRETLAMLAEQSADVAPRRPMPGLGGIGALISTMNDSGLRTDVVVRGVRGDLAAAVDLAAYRIVAQSLANVLRHASSTAATVLIDYTADGVRLEITDDRNEPAEAGADPAEAAGMRERAAAVGGVLVSGPCVGGGFQVRVSLPPHAHGAQRGPRP